VLTKTQAYLGRPTTEKMFNLDHVDLSLFIITHPLEQDYAKKNNFVYFIGSVYDKLKLSNSKKKKNAYDNNVINQCELTYSFSHLFIFH
jgi:hypothetical protein